MPKITPRDIVAVFALLLCAVLLFSGHDGEIKGLMGVIIGYYFGVATIVIQNRKNHEKPKPPTNL